VKFLIIFLAIFIASPVEAITWNQFWRPFRNGGYYYSSPSYYAPRYYNTCKREIYREEYISGNGVQEGYVRRWTEVQRYSC